MQFVACVQFVNEEALGNPDWVIKAKVLVISGCTSFQNTEKVVLEEV